MCKKKLANVLPNPCGESSSLGLDVGLASLSISPSPILLQYVEDEHKLLGVNVLELLDYLLERFADGEITAQSLKQIYVTEEVANSVAHDFGVIPEQVLGLLPENFPVKRLRARKVREIIKGSGQADSAYLLQAKVKIPGFYVSSGRHTFAKLEFTSQVSQALYRKVRDHKFVWGALKKIRFIVPHQENHRGGDLPGQLEIDFTYSADDSEDFPVIVTADYEYPPGSPQIALAGLKRDMAAQLSRYLLFVPQNSVAQSLLRNYWLARNPQKVISKMTNYDIPLPSPEDSQMIRDALRNLRKLGCVIAN